MRQKWMSIVKVMCKMLGPSNFHLESETFGLPNFLITRLVSEQGCKFKKEVRKEGK